jgi:hypothetical protein
MAPVSFTVSSAIADSPTRKTGIPAFLAGTLLILANWPWTLLAIKPVSDAGPGFGEIGGHQQDPRPHRHQEQAAFGADRARRAFGHFPFSLPSPPVDLAEA